MQTSYKLTTNEIEVKVEVAYQSDQSMPVSNQYLFAYRITIYNRSSHPVQLLNRQWLITNGWGGQKTVAGEGVIGLQPKIESAEAFQYMSGCHLETPRGTMGGYYEFVNLTFNTKFDVTIPTFEMLYLPTLN